MKCSPNTFSKAIAFLDMIKITKENRSPLGISKQIFSDMFEQNSTPVFLQNLTRINMIIIVGSWCPHFAGELILPRQQHKEMCLLVHTHNAANGYALTLISSCFKQCVAIVTSPALSNAKISSWDIAFTSFATIPIDFPSRLPNPLKRPAKGIRVLN